MTTVRQLVYELNVSKVSLYAILKKDQFASHVSRGEKNIVLIDDLGVRMLKDYYSGKNKGGPPGKNGSGSIGENAVDINGVIDVLQRQLAKKDEQIDNLLGIVSSRQELHA